jgi:serine/threonine protein phosphatase PrpC
VRALALLGRDWTELGPVAFAELPDGGALALSRGAQPKAYAHVDPNEDGVLLVRAPMGALLALADGFNGVAAAELALDEARRRAAELIEARGAGFRALVAELVRAAEARLPRRSQSRSCLVIAALAGNRCEVASLGDASAFRARATAPLVAPNSLLVGRRDALGRTHPGLWHAQLERAPGERIALVSDGVTNFMPDPTRIAGVLSDAGSDLACARALLQAALEGGAGDNVAAVVFAARAGV